MALTKQKNDRVKVYCRMKPIISKKSKPIEYKLSKRFKNGTLMLNLKNTNLKPEDSKYRFDDVFPSTSSQSMVFENVALPMIDEFLHKNVNCTIFSYGQTGSGKTYTICGSQQDKDKGIIHQTIDRLFSLTQNSGDKFEIKLSFIEIHNNNIRDLAMPDGSSYKFEPVKIPVKDGSAAIKLFQEIISKRKTSSTAQNEYSSRSHFICTIYLTKSRSNQRFDSQFKLVDLAGSEFYNSIECKTSNQIEALGIKKSLYALKNVTRILANPCYKGIIVPFRDSKLTCELQSTLEGKCRVAMIANVDSSDSSLEELVKTCEYAREIASIKKCVVNEIKPFASPFEKGDEKLNIALKNLKMKNENSATELSLLKTKNENELKLFRTKYKNELTLLRARYENELTLLRTKYENKRTSVRTKYENERTSLKTKLSLLEAKNANSIPDDSEDSLVCIRCEAEGNHHVVCALCEYEKQQTKQRRLSASTHQINDCMNLGLKSHGDITSLQSEVKNVFTTDALSTQNVVTKSSRSNAVVHQNSSMNTCLSRDSFDDKCKTASKQQSTTVFSGQTNSKPVQEPHEPVVTGKVVSATVSKTHPAVNSGVVRPLQQTLVEKSERPRPKVVPAAPRAREARGIIAQQTVGGREMDDHFLQTVLESMVVPTKFTRQFSNKSGRIRRKIAN